MLYRGQVLQVDKPVAEAVAVGSKVEKEAWSRTLHVGSGSIELSWSADFRGMVVATPAIFVLVIATAAWATFSRSPPGDADSALSNEDVNDRGERGA